MALFRTIKLKYPYHGRTEKEEHREEAVQVWKNTINIKEEPCGSGEEMETSQHIFHQEFQNSYFSNFRIEDILAAKAILDLSWKSAPAAALDLSMSSRSSSSSVSPALSDISVPEASIKSC